MSLRLFLPHSSLHGYISAYYIFDATNQTGAIDKLLPEWANIRLILTGRWRVQFGSSTIQDVPPAVLNGFISRAPLIVSEGPSRVVGIGIMPKGWARLIGTAADAHVNSICSLTDIFGENANILLNDTINCISDTDIISILDTFFCTRLTESPPEPAIIDAIFSVLMNENITNVIDFANRLGVSVRQTERLCKKYFGFSPKMLLRRQRFLRAFARIRNQKIGTWIDHLELDYVDQSHFIREFQYFVRMSPTKYFGQGESIIRQIADARERFFGQPVQGLYHPERTRHK
jgi:AraC-like DNA-binding protein